MNASTLINSLLGLSMPTIADASGLLFSGGVIVTFDKTAESLRVVRDGSLLVQGDRIVDIFDSLLPEDIPPDVLVIDSTDKIITPGFIDTHRHGWQTVFKTMASNTTLVEYMALYGPFTAEAFFAPDDIYTSQLVGLYETLNAGVTTILDHAHNSWSDEFLDAGYHASIDSGARVFWCPSLNGGPSYSSAQAIEKFKDIAKKAAHEGTATSLGIAYDRFGPMPDVDEVKVVVDLIKDYDVSVLTTHSLGGPWTFTNSPEDLLALGVLDAGVPIVLSHASFLTATGATLLRAYNHYISITPESEMHYGHTHPVAHLIQDQASLGVDTHFTFSSDILSQARIWLQNVRSRVYRSVVERWEVSMNNPMSVNQAFLLATRNGGLALRRDDLGVISRGAKADLLIWDGTSPSLLGWADPVAAVILHASVGDIEHVLVDGRFVKKDGKLVVGDYEKWKTQYLQAAKRIQKALREAPPIEQQEGVVFPPGFGAFLTGKAETVDAQRGPGNGYGPLYT